MLTVKQIIKVSRLMDQTDKWARREAELELQRLTSKVTTMLEPTAQEMEQARLFLLSNPYAYLAAVAAHHSRVAQIAIDLRKAVDNAQFSSVPIDYMEVLAKEIEKSFATAFGVNLRSVVLPVIAKRGDET